MTPQLSYCPLCRVVYYGDAVWCNRHTTYQPTEIISAPATQAHDHPPPAPANDPPEGFQWGSYGQPDPDLQAG